MSVDEADIQQAQRSTFATLNNQGQSMQTLQNHGKGGVFQSQNQLVLPSQGRINDGADKNLRLQPQHLNLHTLDVLSTQQKSTESLRKL